MLSLNKYCRYRYVSLSDKLHFRIAYCILSVMRLYGGCVRQGGGRRTTCTIQYCTVVRIILFSVQDWRCGLQEDEATSTMCLSPAVLRVFSSTLGGCRFLSPFLLGVKRPRRSTLTLPSALYSMLILSSLCVLGDTLLS